MWAVRPTGGGAIFHAEEWTYALAAPRTDPEWGGGPGEAYARACGLIVRSLLRLGVPAEPAARRGEAGAPGGAARGGPAPPCFASTARHEVVLGGAKLVGSAQRRTSRAYLQQGSVLLGDGHRRLADYLAVPDGSRDAVREALARAATGAGAWLGPSPPLERWADALAAELGPAPARRDGASGLALLTLRGSGSYTASVH